MWCLNGKTGLTFREEDWSKEQRVSSFQNRCVAPAHRAPLQVLHAYALPGDWVAMEAHIAAVIEPGMVG
jgi:hypothetical protein